MITGKLLGSFHDDARTRAEFLAFMGVKKATLIFVYKNASIRRRFSSNISQRLCKLRHQLRPLRFHFGHMLFLHMPETADMFRQARELHRLHVIAD